MCACTVIIQYNSPHSINCQGDAAVVSHELSEHDHCKCKTLSLCQRWVITVGGGEFHRTGTSSRSAGAQPRLKSWGGPRFGSQHPPCARPTTGLDVGCKRGSPSHCEGPGYHPRRFFWKLRCQILHSSDYYAY